MGKPSLFNGLDMVYPRFGPRRIFKRAPKQGLGAELGRLAQAQLQAPQRQAPRGTAHRPQLRGQEVAHSAKHEEHGRGWPGNGP